MKIAIHQRKGSFSDQWVEYCLQKGYNFKIVNCFATDIIQQLEDCDVLMWHYHHALFEDRLVAQRILFACEQAGKVVFPDFNTAWHFDDKVGQKYLLEAIDAPLINSHVFYSKKEALAWCETATFPKVFKLRGGAGATNVKIVNNRKQGRNLIIKAFNSGFSQFNGLSHFNLAWSKYKSGSGQFKDLIRAAVRLFHSTDFSKKYNREKGYVYFQDFVPNNYFDIRLIVINDRAYGMKRKVRKGDFRASGSGEFEYVQIDNKTLSIAFKTAKDLGLQSVAFDFVYDGETPLIVEISYGFGTKGSSKCPGYWDSSLTYHEGTFNPFGWMVDLVVEQARNKRVL